MQTIQRVSLRGITNCSASISLSFNFSTLFSELQSRVFQAEVTLVLLLVPLPMLNYYAARLTGSFGPLVSVCSNSLLQSCFSKSSGFVWRSIFCSSILKVQPPPSFSCRWVLKPSHYWIIAIRGIFSVQAVWYSSCVEHNEWM